jgi:hypothetical protein
MYTYNYCSKYAANAKVATVPGFNPSILRHNECEGRPTKQCYKKAYKNPQKPPLPLSTLFLLPCLPASPLPSFLHSFLTSFFLAALFFQWYFLFVSNLTPLLHLLENSVSVLFTPPPPPMERRYCFLNTNPDTCHLDTLPSYYITLSPCH